jgi:hypothetical protein
MVSPDDLCIIITLLAMRLKGYQGYSTLLTLPLLVIRRQNILLRLYIMFEIFFSIENQCDYHQNQVHNISSPAEQTFVGRIHLILTLK